MHALVAGHAIDQLGDLLVHTTPPETSTLTALVATARAEIPPLAAAARTGALTIDELELALASAHHVCAQLAEEVPSLAGSATQLYAELAAACAAHPLARAATALAHRIAPARWSYDALTSAATTLAAEHGVPPRRVVELALGTFPTPWGPSEEHTARAGRYGYAPSTLETIEDALALLAISPDDVFCDLGAGLGLPCFVAALAGATACLGIEYEATYVAQARARAELLGLAGRIELVHGDATTADLARATKLYLFNPFPPPVHAKIVARLRALAHQHPIRIACWHTQLPDDFRMLERRGALVVYEAGA